jgi:hypothetical protein
VPGILGSGVWLGLCSHALHMQFEYTVEEWYVRFHGEEKSRFRISWASISGSEFVVVMSIDRLYNS